MCENNLDLHEEFIDEQQGSVVIFLNNGIKLNGYIKKYDALSLTLVRNDEDMIVFFHSISTMGGN